MCEFELPVGTNIGLGGIYLPDDVLGISPPGQCHNLRFVRRIRRWYMDKPSTWCVIHLNIPHRINICFQIPRLFVEPMRNWWSSSFYQWLAQWSTVRHNQLREVVDLVENRHPAALREVMNRKLFLCEVFDHDCAQMKPIERRISVTLIDVAGGRWLKRPTWDHSQVLFCNDKPANTQ